MNINYFFNKEFSIHINEKKKNFFHTKKQHSLPLKKGKKKKKPNQIKSEI